MCDDLGSVYAPANILLCDALKTRLIDVKQLLSLLYGESDLPLGSVSRSELEEEGLCRLMVQHRSLVEKEPSNIFQPEILDALCRAAVRVRRTHELRYLDALNYFFELCPKYFDRDVSARNALGDWLLSYQRAIEHTLEHLL